MKNFNFDWIWYRCLQKFDDNSEYSSIISFFYSAIRLKVQLE